MNDKNYLTDNIQNLNPDLREAIEKVNYLGALHKIQQDRRLHIDQAAALEKLTFMLMLGEINEIQYLSKLQNELGVTTAEAEEIGGEVQGTILEPIIQKFQGIEHSSLPTESEEVPQQRPAPIVSTAPISVIPPVSVLPQSTFHPSETLKNVPEIEPATANPAVSLTRENILADIEDAASLHTESSAELSPFGPQTLKSIDISIPQPAIASAQPEPSISAGAKLADSSNFNKEIAPESVPIPQINTTPAVSIPTPKNAPLVSPSPSSALGSNMEAPVTSKPTRITTTIDPYLEAI